MFISDSSWSVRSRRRCLLVALGSEFPSPQKKSPRVALNAVRLTTRRTNVSRVDVCNLLSTGELQSVALSLQPFSSPNLLHHSLDRTLPPNPPQRSSGVAKHSIPVWSITWAAARTWSACPGSACTPWSCPSERRSTRCPTSDRTPSAAWGPWWAWAGRFGTSLAPSRLRR